MKVYNGFTGDKSMSDHFTSQVVYNVIEDGNVICINGTADDIFKVIHDIVKVGYEPVYNEDKIGNLRLYPNKIYGITFPPYEEGYVGLYEVFRVSAK